MRWAYGLGIGVLGLAVIPGCSAPPPAISTTRGELTAVTWREVPLLIRRQGGTMATLGNKVVLFGGLGNNVHGDTWEWDGTAWTRKPAPPWSRARSSGQWRRGTSRAA